jgi:hypothetical protein
MPSLAEYFKENRYKAKWDIGDRVFGHYSGIPFIGSVGNDTEISEEEGPRVTIHLDLPIDKKTVIVVKPSDITRLKEF